VEWKEGGKKKKGRVLGAGGRWGQGMASPDERADTRRADCAVGVDPCTATPRLQPHHPDEQHAATCGQVAHADHAVLLDVGGTVFRTSRATLCKYGNTGLARMFAADLGMPPSHAVGHERAYFIDCDPRYFAVVLNFLRHGHVFLSASSPADRATLMGAAAVARQFCIDPLVAACQRLLRRGRRANLLHAWRGCRARHADARGGYPGGRTARQSARFRDEVAEWLECFAARVAKKKSCKRAGARSAADAAEPYGDKQDDTAGHEQTLQQADPSSSACARLVDFLEERMCAYCGCAVARGAPCTASGEDEQDGQGCDRDVADAYAYADADADADDDDCNEEDNRAEERGHRGTASGEADGRGDDGDAAEAGAPCARALWLVTDLWPNCPAWQHKPRTAVFVDAREVADYFAGLRAVGCGGWATRLFAPALLSSGEASKHVRRCMLPYQSMLFHFGTLPRDRIDEVLEHRQHAWTARIAAYTWPAVVAGVGVGVGVGAGYGSDDSAACAGAGRPPGPSAPPRRESALLWATDRQMGKQPHAPCPAHGTTAAVSAAVSGSSSADDASVWPNGPVRFAACFPPSAQPTICPDPPGHDDGDEP